VSDRVDIKLFASPKGEASGKSADFWVDVSFNCRLTGCDYGPGVEAEFGDDDYEYWHELKPASTRALLAALVRDRFGGRPGASAEFQKYLEQNGINAEFGFWH
jgi:hypothetical protein